MPGDSGEDQGSGGNGLQQGRKESVGTERSILDLCYQLAAIAGQNPRQYTLRQLLLMSEAVQVDSWNRTALLCVLLANPNRDTKKRPTPFGIHDFHPFLNRAKGRHKKSASQLLERMSSVDGVQPETVTEHTWQAVKTL